MERCDDRPAELRDVRQCAPVDLDDEFLEAVPEPSREGLVCIADEAFPGRSAYVLSAHSNQASPRSVR